MRKPAISIIVRRLLSSKAYKKVSVGFVAMIASVIIVYPSFAQIDQSENIYARFWPAIWLILFDEQQALDIPFSFNEEVVYKDTFLSVPANSENTLGLDLSQLPEGYVPPTHGVELLLSGNCYSLGGATLDPLIYDWDIFATNAGSCEITLKVSSEIDGVVETLSVTKDITIEPDIGGSPELSLSIAVTNNQSYSAVGQIVAYEYTVTNEGDASLDAPFMIDDDKATGISCPDDASAVGDNSASLDKGETIICVGTYVISQQDIDAGSVTNSATAIAMGPNAATIESAVAIATAQSTRSAELSLIKVVVQGDPYAHQGDTVLYQYTLSNTGNVTLKSPFVIEDDKILPADINCPLEADLGVGESVQCLGNYHVVQSDIDTGSVTNIAIARVSDLEGAIISSDSVQVTANALASPALILSVEVIGELPFATVDAALEYKFTMRNEGNSTLSAPFAIEDDQFDSVVCPVDASAEGNGDADLNVGEELMCSATRTITQDDIDAGSLTNTSAASAADNSGNTISSPSVQTTVNGLQDPALMLIKVAISGDPFTAVDDTIEYGYTISNTGNETLNGPFSIIDDQIASVTCPADASAVGDLDAALDPGESVECTASDTVTAADMANGGITNSANAAAVDSSGSEIRSATVQLTVNAVQNPILDLVVAVTSGAPFSAASETLELSYTLSNSGNEILSGPFEVSDDQVPGIVCEDIASVGNNDSFLDISESLQCTGSYTVTQGDVDFGSVTSNASASATDPSAAAVNSETIQTLVNADQTPELSLAKAATSGAPFSELNGLIEYSYTLSNSGNETLHAPFTVSDDKIASVDCPADTELAVGASMQCTASYSVTQADLDVGNITNTASASASDPSGAEITSASVQVSVEGAAVAALTLFKEITGGDPYILLDDVIDYRYRLSNTGLQTLRPPFMVTDDKIASVGCPPNANGVGNNNFDLDPGESIECTASYVVSAEDLTAGSVTNAAFASALNPLNILVTSPTVQATADAVLNPALGLSKQITSGSPYSAVDDSVTYSYTLTNTGAIALIPPFTVVDDKIATVNCPADASAIGNNDAKLDVDESVDCTAVEAITQEDIDAGFITNIATASARELTGGVILSEAVEVTADADQTPALTIDKQVDSGSPYAAAGAVVAYSYTVTNTGNVSVDNLAVTDDKITTVSCDVTTLAPGEQAVCTADYTVTQQDIDDGSLTNTASAAGTDPNAAEVSSAAVQATANATQAPSLLLDKQIVQGDPYAAVDDAIEYSYTLTNDGNETLNAPFTVNDDKIASVNCPADASATGNGDAALDVGESVICIATYTVLQTDLDAGSILNTASGQAVDVNGGAITSPAVQLIANSVVDAALGLLKEVSAGDPFAVVDDVIDYTYTLSNDGNKTLVAPFVVEDDKIATVICPPVAILAVGETLVCSASYTVSQLDIDEGGVTNTATASGQDTNGASISSPVVQVTANASQNAVLDLAKSVISGDGYGKVGDEIIYRYTLSNSGNKTLLAPFVVRDDKIAAVSCDAATSILPGESLICEGIYPVTQADLDAQKVVNTASASAADTQGALISSATAQATANADTTPPTLTLIGSDPLILQQRAVYVEPGASAIDAVDGDVSVDVVVGGDIVDTGVPGDYVVTYNVSDSEGNAAAQISRTVTVVEDVTPPAAPSHIEIVTQPDGSIIISGRADLNTSVEITFPSGEVMILSVDHVDQLSEGTFGPIASVEPFQPVGDIIFTAKDVNNNVSEPAIVPFTDDTTDTDSDNIIDIIDIDDDNDGLEDSIEDAFADGDTDGIPNRLDLDSDGDGLPDTFEGNFLVTDGDNDGIVGTGTPLDSDGDGLADSNDPDSGFDAATNIGFNQDRDNDGIKNFLDTDIDGDGIDDNIEGQPTVGFIPLPATLTDVNGNGLEDAYDVAAGGIGIGYTNTDGGSAPDYADDDSDNDGISDLIETAANNAWRVATDNDGDGLLDGFDLDDDNDGILDSVEGETDDSDGDGYVNSLDLDSDGDGIPDYTEALATGVVDDDGHPGAGVYVKTAVDADGIPNGIGSAGLMPANMDGADAPDYLDLDSDNDGLFDAVEGGGTDANNDGILGAGLANDTDADGLADEVDPLDDRNLDPLTGVPLVLPNNSLGAVVDYLNTDDLILAPVFTSSASAAVDENQMDAITLMASDTSAVTYSISNADAADFVVNSVTGVVTFQTPPDFEIKESYAFTATATDIYGNTTPQDITITIIDLDEVPPVTTLIGDDPILLEAGDTYTDPGVTANDDVDGDITANVAVSGDTVDASQVGTYTVRYDVMDAALNAAVQITREVTVSATLDTQPPAITLLGDAAVTLDVGGAYIDAGATANDDVDNDITADIVIVNPVDTTTAGVYIVTYNVMDSALNASVEVTRTVTVTDLMCSIEPPAPTFTHTVSATDQTYINAGKPGNNFSGKSFMQLRSTKNKSSRVGLVYFDIPEMIDGKTVGEITQATLSFTSIDDVGEISVYLMANSVQAAGEVTWNNTSLLFPFSSEWNTKPSLSNELGTGVPTGLAYDIAFTGAIQPGQMVFLIDENADIAAKKIHKDMVLDIVYAEKVTPVIDVQQVKGTLLSKFGDAIEYDIKLLAPPGSDVILPMSLSNDVATISSNELTFTAANWNIAQTVTLSSNSSATGNEEISLVLNALRSSDPNYACINPLDVELVNQGLKIESASASFAINSGEPFSHPVNVLTNQADPELKTQFSLIDAPAGMSINVVTGIITWQPGVFQVGDHHFEVLAQVGDGTASTRPFDVTVIEVSSNPVGLYVAKDGIDLAGRGSIDQPYKTLQFASTQAVKGDTVYVRGGRYFNKAEISSCGTKNKKITFTRLPGERVKFGFLAFSIHTTIDACYLVFDGFEIDGNAAVNSHEEVLANTWWNADYFVDETDNGVEGGFTAFLVEGNHIEIQNNVIHDTNQKAVNIAFGRYVTVKGNVIYNIGHSSLSGGHGIMKQWELNFEGNPSHAPPGGYPPEEDFYRFDFYGNLLFAVEQRIYSRVWGKYYVNFAIDEGKAILIDRTDDINMKARVAHNLVVFNGTDHIRLKRTPNMELFNNSVMTEVTRVSPDPDGITDKAAMPNLEFYNNAVVSREDSKAIDVDDSFRDENDVEITTPESLARRHDNYIAGGLNVANIQGITNLGVDGQIFNSPLTNDFSIVPSLPQTIGVSPENLDHIFALVDDYGVDVKPSGWVHNHERMTQLILENIPDRYSNPEIGPSTIEEGHLAIYFDITPEWREEFPRTFEKFPVYQVVVPHEWSDIHAGDYPPLTPGREIDNGGKINQEDDDAIAGGF